MAIKFPEKFSFVDLTHSLSADTPVWPGVQPFLHQQLANYDEDGYKCFSFLQSEGVGTHMDSPSHFAKNGRTISDLSCEDLIAPACVIDVREKTATNPDYKISVTDIENWEQQNGKIEARSLVLGLTGWSQYWDDTEKYHNMDENEIQHFPGWSKEAAEFLLTRNIVGVGIDTLSIDAGANLEFSAHHVFLEHDKYQIENLTNLDKLPSKGAIVFALPIKIKNGAEAPIRAVAVC